MTIIINNNNNDNETTKKKNNIDKMDDEEYVKYCIDNLYDIERNINKLNEMIIKIATSNNYDDCKRETISMYYNIEID